LMVMVEDKVPAGIGLGLKLTVTPLGAPEEESEIAASNPPEGVTVRVEVPLEPAATETEGAEGVRVKLGPVVTVKVTVAWFVMLPPVPMTVMM